MTTHTQKTYKQSFYSPLTCWDVCALFQAEVNQKQKDLYNLRNISNQQKWRIDWNLDNALFTKDDTILVVNLEQTIIYASSNIYSMTGYTKEEVMGKNPKILQGVGTEAKAKAQIRDAVMASESFEAEITNYRKSGKPYTCHIQGHPVFDKEEKLINYIAFEHALN